MNKVKRSGALHSMALLALTACVAAPAMAYDQRGDSIFSRIEPSLRDRAFMRLNYIHANVKTTSGEAYDVTGPVVARGDIGTYLGNTTNPLSLTAQYGASSMFYRVGSSTLRTSSGYYNIINTSLEGAIDSDIATTGCQNLQAGLGSPCGIRAKSSASLGTPAISVGYYLDEGMNWMLEAFLLAAPLKAKVYGEGNNQLNGQHIIDLKILPPTAVLGRYFGESNARIRPFVGMGASYAIFFDVRATSALNTYQGGGGADDTTVSVKNTLGFGPFFGVKAQLDDDWHLSLNVGKLRYSTEATLITRNTTITADSQVIFDYGPQTTVANTVAVNVTGGRPGTVAPASGNMPQLADSTVGQSVQPLTALMCDLALAKYGNTSCNHGTFVRKQKTKLDNTLFMFSVGRRF